MFEKHQSPSAGLTGTEIELGHVERLVALRGFPGAHAMGSAELVALASIAEPLRFEKGARLVAPDETVAAMFVVVDGTVSVWRAAGASEARVEAGGIVGAAHAFARDATGLLCDAATDAIVVSLRVEDLEDVFEDHPPVLFLTARELARRVIAEGHVTTMPRGRRRRGDADVPTSIPDRRLDLVERLLFLRRDRVLGAASLDGVAALASSAVEVRRAPGEVLWRVGEPSSTLLTVLAGTVDVFSELDGAGPVLRSAGVGDRVGELDCIAERPRRDEAVAGAGLVALELDRDAMFDAWEDHVDLGMEVLRSLAGLVLAPGPSARSQEPHLSVGSSPSL